MAWRRVGQHNLESAAKARACGGQLIKTEPNLNPSTAIVLHHARACVCVCVCVGGGGGVYALLLPDDRVLGAFHPHVGFGLQEVLLPGAVEGPGNAFSVPLW